MQHEELPFNQNKDEILQQNKKRQEDQISSMQKSKHQPDVKQYQKANSETNTKILEFYKDQLYKQNNIESDEEEKIQTHQNKNQNNMNEIIQKQQQKEQVFKKIYKPGQQPDQQQDETDLKQMLCQMEEKIGTQETEIKQLNQINQEIINQLNKVISTFTEKFDLLNNKLNVVSTQLQLVQQNKMYEQNNLQQIEINNNQLKEISNNTTLTTKKENNDNQQMQQINIQTHQQTLQNNIDRKNTIHEDLIQHPSKQISQNMLIKEKKQNIDNDFNNCSNQNQLNVVLPQQDDNINIQQIQITNLNKLSTNQQPQQIKNQHSSKQQSSKTVQKYEQPSYNKATSEQIHLQSKAISSINYNKQLMKQMPVSDPSDDENIQISAEAQALVQKFDKIKQLLGM